MPVPVVGQLVFYEIPAIFAHVVTVILPVLATLPGILAAVFLTLGNVVRPVLLAGGRAALARGLLLSCMV